MINFEYLYKQGYKDNHFLDLIKVKQRDFKFLSDGINRLIEDGLVVKKSNKYKLTRKGNSFLDNIFSNNMGDVANKLAAELIGLYQQYGKPTGTFLEVKNRLEWFLDKTGFNTKVIYEAVDEYLQSSGEYTKRLDNLIWTPQSKAFSVYYQLKDSKLFDLIASKYGLLQTRYDEKPIRALAYAIDISKLEVPRDADDAIYFKSYKEDREHVLQMKSKILEYLRGKIDKESFKKKK